MGSVKSFFSVFFFSPRRQTFRRCRFCAGWAAPSVRVIRVVAVGRGAGRGRASTVPVPVSLRSREKENDGHTTKEERVSEGNTWLLCQVFTLTQTILHNLKISITDLIYSGELLSQIKCKTINSKILNVFKKYATFGFLFVKSEVIHKQIKTNNATVGLSKLSHFLSLSLESTVFSTQNSSQIYSFLIGCYLNTQLFVFFLWWLTLKHRVPDALFDVAPVIFTSVCFNVSRLWLWYVMFLKSILWQMQAKVLFK